MKDSNTIFRSTPESIPPMVQACMGSLVISTWTMSGSLSSTARVLWDCKLKVGKMKRDRVVEW